jgi:RNA polymerase sigma-B factor
MSSSTATSLSTDPSHASRGTTLEAGRQSRAERTNQLVQALASCDDDEERLRLTNQLAAVNMEVADSVVARYRSRGIATEDLQQAAYLALTKAARRFDPCSGHDFLSFCVPTIRGEVRRYFRDKGWVVRPPRRIQELQQRIGRAQEDLATRLGRPPSAEELAEDLDEDPSDVREALDGQGCFSPASLDRPVAEDGDAVLGELLPSEDREQEAAEARVVLAPVVRRLSTRDRRILELRFFDGLTQREIAEDIGVTQMQVSRLLTRIFRDLREGLVDPETLNDIPA